MFAFATAPRIYVRLGLPKYPASCPFKSNMTHSNTPSRDPLRRIAAISSSSVTSESGPRMHDPRSQQQVPDSGFAQIFPKSVCSREFSDSVTYANYLEPPDRAARCCGTFYILPSSHPPDSPTTMPELAQKKTN